MRWRENQVQIKLTLLVIIGVIGIGSICFFANKAFQSLRVAVNEFQYPDQKIKTLNSLLDQTNRSDQFLRLYSITKKKQYISNYDVALDSINQLFTTYRSYLQNDTSKANQIDSIQTWWNKKVVDNKALIKLNRDKPDILVIGKIIENSKDTTLYSTQIFNERTIRDSLVIIKKIPFNNEEKTGILYKVKRLFDKKEDEGYIADSTGNMDIQLFSYTYKSQDTTITDTLVKIEPFNKTIKTSVKNVLHAKLSYDTIVDLKRLEIIEKDFLIRNRIDKQIKLIQKKEQADALSNITAIQTISSDALNQIFVVFILILTSCFCLYILLVLDSYKIKRYEQKLLVEKYNYQNLANNRSDFLSMMAHELRTPLQSIIGFSDLLYMQQNKQLDKSSHYSEIIKKSSSHLLETINLLLDRSKIDAGKLELENIPFNLSDCILDVFESLSIQAKEKSFSYLIDSTVPNNLIVKSDSFRLKQILYNLLNNAIKFTDEGKVLLTSKIINEDTNIIHVQIEIIDTGIGISKEKIKKLFQNYEQLDKSTGRLYGGTGLGLVITKKIVTLFNSTLNIQSNNVTGTIFSFNLALEKSTLQHISAITTVHYTDTTMLIIDDDSYNLLYTYQLLNNSFKNIYVASSIKEGIQIIQTKKPNIILCDLYIHNSLGTELIQHLNDKTEIIFMSADHDYLNELKKLEYHTIAKPFTLENISGILNNLNNNNRIFSIYQQKNLTETAKSNTLHTTSLLDKINKIELALHIQDLESILFFLHQIKTTMGYLENWEAIKEIQKEETKYELYKNDISLKKSVLIMLNKWKITYLI